MAGRYTTLIVDPDTRGHHLQSVAAVAEVASESGPVVYLTSRGTSQEPAFTEYLGELAARGTVQVEEVFDDLLPSTKVMVAVAADWCRRLEGRTPVGTFVHMDADQTLKRWWVLAPRAFRGVRPMPRFVFMLTRYPARLRITDLQGLRLRVPKALLVLAARMVRRLDRVSGFSGRDETRSGWLVKRALDPNVSSAHARDRQELRIRLNLPAERKLVGIFGAIDPRKNAPLLLEAMKRSGHDASLVLAGAVDPETQAWLDDLEPADRDLMIVRDGYLSNQDLDSYIAAVDVIPLALTNNGPSGVMGKAQASGTPVVTAGSLVRAREVSVMGGGIACDLDVESLADGIRQVFDGTVVGVSDAAQLVSPRAYAEVILGLADLSTSRDRT